MGTQEPNTSADSEGANPLADWAGEGGALGEPETELTPVELAKAAREAAERAQREADAAAIAHNEAMRARQVEAQGEPDAEVIDAAVVGERTQEQGASLHDAIGLAAVQFEQAVGLPPQIEPDPQPNEGAPLRTLEDPALVAALGAHQRADALEQKISAGVAALDAAVARLGEFSEPQPAQDMPAMADPGDMQIGPEEKIIDMAKLDPNWQARQEREHELELARLGAMKWILDQMVQDATPSAVETYSSAFRNVRGY